MGAINTLGSTWSLVLLLFKGVELLTVDLTFSALWYECSCNTWWLLELDVLISDVCVIILGADTKLLWTVDKGDGCHWWDGLSLCFWFNNAVGSIDWGGKDIVTELECIWDPSPVVNCITGWDMASIFSNCAFGIFITIWCCMGLPDTIKLGDDVINGLACNILPTVSVVYFVLGGVGASCLVVGADVEYSIIRGWGAVVLVTRGGGAAILVTGGTVILVTGAAVLLVTGGAVLLVRGGGGVAILVTGGAVILVTGGAALLVTGAVILVTGGGGAAILVTGSWGVISLVTEDTGIINLTCDAVEVIDIVVEFVPCAFVELTVVTVGLGGLVVEVSFFTLISFGCFTIFLAVVDAKI